MTLRETGKRALVLGGGLFLASLPGGLATNLVAAAVLATVAVGSLTGLLYRLGFVTYEPMPDHPAKLLDFYGWHLVDAVPVFKIWKALGVEAPMQAANRLADVLLFLYQTLVLASAVDIYRQKRLSIDGQLREARALRTLGNPRNARRRAELALHAADGRGDRIRGVDARIELAMALTATKASNDEVERVLQDARTLLDKEVKTHDFARRRTRLAEVAARAEGADNDRSPEPQT